MAPTLRKSTLQQRRSAPNQALGKRDDGTGQAGSRHTTKYNGWQKTTQEREDTVSTQPLGEFQSVAENMKTDILTQLQRSEQALIKSETDHIQRITAAYGSHRHSQQQHRASKTGEEVLRACHELLAQHDRTSRLAQGRKQDFPERSSWRQDGDWVQQMLYYGRQYGEGVVQSIIFPDLDAALLQDPGEDELDEAGKEAVNMFQKSRKTVQKETWGKVAQAQIMAISTLVGTASRND